MKSSLANFHSHQKGVNQKRLLRGFSHCQLVKFTTSIESFRTETVKHANLWNTNCNNTLQITDAICFQNHSKWFWQKFFTRKRNLTSCTGCTMAEPKRYQWHRGVRSCPLPKLGLCHMLSPIELYLQVHCDLDACQLLYNPTIQPCEVAVTPAVPAQSSMMTGWPDP